MNYTYFADDVKIGQKVRFTPDAPYYQRHVTLSYEGIVVGIDHYMVDESDVMGKITFSLWAWDGIEEVSVWESEPVEVL